ncbi:MAG: glycosyltransferase family 4 protein, partial [Deltaproteobacteria bacterium]|nr:glycosyltransferase family 4 protein [Deltaproteobacteria bacterium]
MKVALVHDWLVQQRGGEQVLLELARLFPGAPIYTLVHAPGSVHPEIEAHPIVPSLVQRLPGAPQTFRPYLPLFPAAVEAWDLSSYDLVVSSSHCVAKGVRVPAH